ncbi:SPW repeat domain-containing protein [Dactylosporangium sp. CA-052675]|uniref:SPW repeat domain-containing protein n=1 Tax=Dactylosporangium sp. CA-052675 TaxID=3239927 RepID=UPI003D8E5E65
MSSFISEQDFTTPAHIRLDPVAPERPPAARATRTLPLTVVFLAAVWLVVSAVPFGYIGAGRYDIFWSDAVTGIALAVTTLIRLLKPSAAGFTPIIGGLAGWVLVAPLVLRFGWSASTANDIAVGLLILTCAAFGPEERA